jgi:hypothetical protein
VKPSSFFIGVVDFFAAFLPGLVVVGVFVTLAGVGASALGPFAESSEAAALLLFGGAYLVGALLNALASRVLDAIFERYQSAGPRPGNAPPENSEWRLIDRVNEELARERVNVPLAKPANPYPLVRSYLHLALPRTATEVDRFEAEQKLFRTTTVGAFLVAVTLTARVVDDPSLRTVSQIGGIALALGITALAYERYVELRKKTIRRAYHYFLMRAVASAEPRAAEPSSAHAAEDGEE